VPAALSHSHFALNNSPPKCAPKKTGLAPDLRAEWRLLFASSRHGASFSTLAGRITGGGDAAPLAPTLLLVRDKGGALFGGVAHEPWQRSGKFYGARVYCVLALCFSLWWCGLGCNCAAPAHTNSNLHAHTHTQTHTHARNTHDAQQKHKT
jgi:hypothetical protein